jgi:hypothetical protein
MSFGFGVGDIILVSQMSWRIWQACTTGRKSATGELRELESDLWGVSTGLERLASSMIAALGGQEHNQQGCSDLKIPVDACKATLLEVDALLEKYRPSLAKAESDAGLKKWASRAKQSWRQVLWTNEKDTIVRLRARLCFHLQVLDTFANQSIV